MRWAVQPGETPLFGTERGCAGLEQELLQFDGPGEPRRHADDDEVLYVLAGGGTASCSPAEASYPDGTKAVY